MAKNKTEEHEDEEPDLVMVGDGADEDDNASEPPARSKKKVLVQNNEDTEEEAEVESDRLGHDDDDERETETEEESEESGDKAKDRRAERKTRKQRQREARERDRTELNFLRQRNEQLERRFSGVEARLNQNEQQTIAQRLAQVKSNLQQADIVLAEAMKSGQGDDAVEALKIRDTLVKEQTRLEIAATNSKRQPPPNTVTPEHKQLATEFLSRNPWLREGGNDAAVFASLDNTLLQEGRLNPGTPAYWRELEKRAKRYLPDRFKGKQAQEDQDDDEDLDEDEAEEEETERKPAGKVRGKNGSSKPAGGPKIRIGGRDVPLRKGQVHVSAERRKAMEEAGVWDNPELRKQYLASYAKYDRESARGNKH